MLFGISVGVTNGVTDVKDGLKQNHSFGMALQTYMGWFESGNVRPTEIDRLYRCIRESRQRDSKVEVGPVLASYINWLFHARVSFKTHVAVLKASSENLKKTLGEFGEQPPELDNDQNEWIRRIYRALFATEQIRADFKSYFSQFGCKLDRIEDQKLIDDLIRLTIEQLYSKVMDLSGDLMLHGEYHSESVLKHLGSRPLYVVCGIGWNTTSPDRIDAEALIAKRDGGVIMLQFPVIGEGIDHQP